jgi:hypothetical protein
MATDRFFIEVVGLSEATLEDMARRDGERAGRNRRAWEQGRRARSAVDVEPGDRVMPLDYHWQRGAGRVEEVERGRVWAWFGPRENPHPSDTKNILVFMPWWEVIIFPRPASIVATVRV